MYCTDGLYTPHAGGPRNASSSAPRAATNTASYAAGAVYLAYVQHQWKWAWGIKALLPSSCLAMPSYA